MAYSYLGLFLLVFVCGITGKIISGGKATGAILTGGLSLLVTRLFRKETATRAHCNNCKQMWVF